MPKSDSPATSNLATLSAKPWENYPIPEHVFLPRGMIGFEERRMLYWLAAEYYGGAGVVVDAGAYLGASSFALAAGLAHSRHRASQHATVHAYDRFVASDDYVRDDISLNFSPVDLDYDYYPVFEFQTALHRDRIVAHRGDFLEASAPQSPIEILFIDVAKTDALNNRLVARYFTQLIPGKSVLLQQDYYQAWYPYIPITMEYFRDWLTVADANVDDSSRLYLLTAKVPQRVLQRFLDGLSLAEESELLRRAIERDSGRARMMLRVAEVLHLVDRQGRQDEARAAAIALRRDPEFQPDAYYAAQLASIEQYRGFV
ncbi:MAG TPA: hypothetical protein VGR70_08330 [Stellaceae bacterium]|nr:hypothetical protein [Stellaceae bacterium]